MVHYPSGSAIPPKIYRYALTDEPGVVAANNYLTLFNPANSRTSHTMISLVTSTYAQGASVNGGSLVFRRITAASGGTLIDPSTLVRFSTDDPNPLTVVRIGNPVVAGPGLAMRGIPPVIAVGAASGGPGTNVSPGNTGFVLLPGQGMVFATAGGTVNQLWNVSYTWGEVPL